jgi:hypothetical protein
VRLRQSRQVSRRSPSAFDPGAADKPTGSAPAVADVSHLNLHDLIDTSGSVGPELPHMDGMLRITHPTSVTRQPQNVLGGEIPRTAFTSLPRSGNHNDTTTE